MNRADTIRVHVNGKPETLAAGVSLLDLLKAKAINPNVVACELNLTVVRRKDLGATLLKEGDELEVIQMIGGG